MVWVSLVGAKLITFKPFCELLILVWIAEFVPDVILSQYICAIFESVSIYLRPSLIIFETNWLLRPFQSQYL